MAILVLAVGVPAVSYVMLSTPWAQKRMRAVGQDALTRLLGTPVEIGEVSFSPFNRLNLERVNVMDENDSMALEIKKLYLRIELADLIVSQKFIVDYAVIEGLRANIYQKDGDSTLNITPIIQRFQKKEKNPNQSNFQLRLNSFEIVDGQARFNKWGQPTTPGRFNPAHINVTDLNLQVFAPMLSNSEFQARIRHLSFKEQCGFQLSNMQARLIVTEHEARLQSALVALPNSLVKFEDMDYPIDGLASLGKLGVEQEVILGIENGSHVFPPDLQAFCPELGRWNLDCKIALQAQGLLDSLAIHDLELGCEAIGATVSLTGLIKGLPNIKEARAEDLSLAIEQAGTITGRAEELLKMRQWPAEARRALTLGGHTRVSINGAGDMNGGEATIEYHSLLGTVSIWGEVEKLLDGAMGDVEVEISDFDLGDLLHNQELGRVSGTVNADGSLTKVGGKSAFIGNAEAQISDFTFKGYQYHDISAMAEIGDSLYSGNLAIADPNATLSLSTRLARSSSGYAWGALRGDIGSVNLDTLNLYKSYPGHILSTQLNVYGEGYNPKEMKAGLQINDLRYVDAKQSGLKMRRMSIDANNMDNFGTISISSDYINGSLDGEFDFTTMGQSVQEILRDVFPSLLGEPKGHATAMGNNFSYDLTISDAENPCQFFKLPVSILDPVSITSALSDKKKIITLNVDADWLLQGDKVIETTYVVARLDGNERNGKLYLTTLMPTKKGPMNLLANVDASDGLLLTGIDWEIIRDIPINGRLAFDIYLKRLAQDSPVEVTVEFEPGEITFGEEVWDIQPSEIVYSDKRLEVKDFSLKAPTQSVSINGKASEDPADVLRVDLKRITLIDIFETLEIDKALICGSATGTIFASQLFSGAPHIQSQGFHVEGIGYNGCVLGNADLEIGFDNETQSVTFVADIIGDMGNKSHIAGSITPATEELDFYFDADHVKIGFLKPFMDAFCSDIEGYATGKAHLFGDFKYIDMEGDIMADTVRLKIDFTNTWYSTSTPLKITPGAINLDNITIYDRYGNTAKLNGVVHHKYFKQPTFDFAITDARNFLSYDIKKEDNPRWYGTIFGNGSAFVKGEPGVVTITVNMQTADNSTFTFELLDTEEAAEYSFIVFNDATPVIIEDEFIDFKSESNAEHKAKSLQNHEEEDEPTAFNLDITVDITPSAQVNIVMDPIGGDAIRAYGQGLLRLTYGSVDEELMMLGSYTLERGDYNFTLQDIIIKDFKIRQGSSITFTGDPYAAVLNIDAIYATNANLSDLDESFLSDKDLNRTNVPVYAVLMVNGNMQQPDITFDLEFPTLTQDTYRKVKSIVSTEDMMNRQIIYLLALNRFYTPDYMASTTKGNELFSVASSTIASQLSSMLGKLSDNWSIAPNLRSDKGDFSDVEVDVALSSSLLNNRLLFNGNFGYRDKSLNTNQFVGDFDIEYLLDRGGKWRLKAYNRYNDQNYYLRTAQTTQGVGVIIRRDFDDILGFLKRKKKETAPADSTKTE